MPFKSLNYLLQFFFCSRNVWILTENLFWTEIWSAGPHQTPSGPKRRPPKAHRLHQFSVWKRHHPCRTKHWRNWSNRQNGCWRGGQLPSQGLGLLAKQLGQRLLWGRWGLRRSRHSWQQGYNWTHNSTTAALNQWRHSSENPVSLWLFQPFKHGSILTLWLTTAYVVLHNTWAE